MIDVVIQEKRFGPDVILQDMALRIDPGDCIALLGPSGIGKSTLMRIAAGLDRDFKGRAQMPQARAMVFQEPNLLPWRSVAQNITLFHPDLAERAVFEMLDRVGLAGRETFFPGQLSLGQQRRLALARAFAGQPAALFLDEPYASLDPQMAEEMARLTRALIDEIGPATLFITHDAREAERLRAPIVRLDGCPATLHPA